MDILDLDPAVLEATATVIESYCAQQKAIMENYLSSASSLSSEWTDDETFGRLLEEIRMLKNNVTNIMDEIRTIYPQYFRNKAQVIRDRPKL